MRDKYVKECYPKWFEFGNGKTSNDLMIGYNTKREDDLNTHDKINDKDVKSLIKEHNLTVQALCDIAIAWSKKSPKDFTEYWYEEREEPNQSVGQLTNLANLSGIIKLK